MKARNKQFQKEKTSASEAKHIYLLFSSQSYLMSDDSSFYLWCLRKSWKLIEV